ncbi:hypothetical protein [Paenibacillus xerothermodurans]|uniref:Uncharacterized protein n=1 Tax=Paenibacillus xerothermodurans TaxID=1977292 RepID=A0A2W1NGQ4_PAEXE|nr:hypothetical protein [Paenibacillus xerothermodurans]PZE22880.1 hypothetical protein CBW46_001775 [Paenibacillus xerothermodurans]
MRDRTAGGSSCEQAKYVTLGDRHIAEIIITNHARHRWVSRVESAKTGFTDIRKCFWNCLRSGRIQPYYKNEHDVYVVEDDLVLVAEFTDWDAGANCAAPRLQRMVMVTFLGWMSETIELSDLWLRHSRRMTLLKNGRKRR